MTAIKEPSFDSEEEKGAAQIFVDRLLDEGRTITCDKSNDSFDSSYALPTFYDDELFNKGKQFFHKHIFAMYFCALHGLLAILAVPTILNVLIMTKMSGNNMLAYRRYVATLMHMMVWYDKDFKPGSDSWRSIAAVRKLHNAASQRAKKTGVNHISQMDMALTQFGFIGFALARRRKVGIHEAAEEEWAGLIHLWRVVGHLLGIEDRFNMCRGTVDETKQICNLLIRRVFKPSMEEKNEHFLEMSGYLTQGLWSVNPTLQYESFLTFNHSLLSLTDDVGRMEPTFFNLSGYAKFKFGLLTWTMKMLKYSWFRWYQNCTIYITLFLLAWFPFLAIYRFGTSNSYVKIKMV